MKPTPEFSYTIEARLAALHSSLVAHAVAGVYLSANEVRQIVDELEHVQIEAVAMRNELSAKRWNSRCDNAALTNLVHRQVSDGNVCLFPQRARPVPKMALQNGGRS